MERESGGSSAGEGVRVREKKPRTSALCESEVGSNLSKHERSTRRSDGKPLMLRFGCLVIDCE